MPIYEYACSKCDEVIEKIQKFSDPLLKKHEECGGTLTKLISQSSFQLKGSGWYVTDYARKGPKDGGEAGDSNKDESKSGSNKDESKSGSNKDESKSGSNKDGDKTSRGETTDSAGSSDKKTTKTVSKSGAKT
jgi:putative FmdB family regulatory protein